VTAPSSLHPPPRNVEEYAGRTVEYVRRALGLPLEYDSDTLPLLDHYLTTVPQDRPEMIELVVATAGAYFGEVVRRHIGGRWDGTTEEVAEWRMILPTGVQFSPAGFVAAAITRTEELEDFDSGLDAPPRMRPYLADALSRMGEVTEDDYYSLCGRLDTLEHVHAVLLAVAAKLLGNPDGDTDGDGDAADLPEPPEPIDPN
jgi:hypothetical protein